MAEVNFGLLTAAPAQPFAIPSPMDGYNQAAATDLTKAQTNAADVNSQSQQQEMGFKKLGMINQLAGSVMQNPTQENLAAAKQMAKMADVDISGIPDDINAALPYIKNAYAASGQQLSMMKAQAEIEMSRATLGLKAADVNVNALKGASEAYNQGTPYSGAFAPYTGMGGGAGGAMPGTPGTASVSGIQGFPSVGVPLIPGGSSNGAPTQSVNALNPSANALAGVDPNANVTSTRNVVPYIPGAPQNPYFAGATKQPQAAVPQQQQPSNAPYQYPGIKNISSAQLMFPAEKKAQEEQATNWEKLNQGVSTGASGYLITKNTISDAKDANHKRLFGNIAGVVPDALLKDPDTQRLEKDANYLFQGLIKSLSASGIQRLDIPIVNAVMRSLPEKGKYASVNDDILDKLNAANEIVGKIAPQVIQTLNAQGIKDPVVAQNLINKIVERTGAYDAKNGAIDMDKLGKWETQFRNILDPRAGKNPATGQDVGYGDFFTKTKAANPNASENDINQLWQTKYLGAQQPQQNSVTASNQPQANGQQMAQNGAGGDRDAVIKQVVPRLAEAIGKFESGGDYQAVGRQTSSGDRAYGKYQVMGQNVGKWTREAFGQPMSIQQFLANPQAQDAVAQMKLAQHVSKHGTLEDAASAWFSGQPLRGNYRRDANGTNVPGYVRSVGRNYAGMQ